MLPAGAHGPTRRAVPETLLLPAQGSQLSACLAYVRIVLPWHPLIGWGRVIAQGKRFIADARPHRAPAPNGGVLLGMATALSGWVPE